MGLFWDLIQQEQIEDQKSKADTLEARVEILEAELAQTRTLLKDTLLVLEEHVGKDIDKDGKIG